MAFTCLVVADVVAPEVDSHFKAVTSTSNREVIDDSPLRDVAALWERGR